MHKTVDPLADELLSGRDVAQLTGISENTLRYWRYMGDGRGPKSFTIGLRKVVYRRSDVEQWIQEQYARARA